MGRKYDWKTMKWVEDSHVDDFYDDDDSWQTVSYRPVKSASQYLRQTNYGFGNWDQDDKKSDQRDALLEVLQELNKTVNLTQNSVDGSKEKTLVVRWSDGTQKNTLTNNIVYVSPDVIRDGNGNVFDKSSDEYYAGLDALNGQAMLASFMRKNLNQQDHSRYTYSSNWAMRNLFQTDLQLAASAEIGDKWPGFESYIEQQRKTFQMQLGEVMMPFVTGNVGLDDFVNLLCYNTLNPNPVSYGDLFEPKLAGLLQQADDFMRQKFASPAVDNKRWNRCVETHDYIKQLLEQYQQDQQGQGQDQQGQGQDQQGQGQDQQGQGQGQQGQGQDQQDSQSKGNAQGNHGKDQKDDQTKAQGQRHKIKSIQSRSDSALDRKIAGDNLYGNNLVSNNQRDNVSEMNHAEQIEERQKIETDKLSQIKSDLLDKVTFQKVIPAVNALEIEQYNKVVRSNRISINTIKQAFDFQKNEARLQTHGLTYGDIDENNLHQISMGEFEYLYQRDEVLARQKWLIGLLIDQSGSMGGERIDQARKLSILMVEALKSLPDLEHCVYGFSTGGSKIQTFVYKDREINKTQALSRMMEHDGTAIGHHVAHVGDKMLKQYPDVQNKIMFVLTDGSPTHTGNHGLTSIQHTRAMVDLLRKQGIMVFGIGLDNAFPDSIGNELFGEGQYAILKDVSSALPLLVKRIRTVLDRAKI